MIKQIILILALMLSQTVANDDREPIAYDYLSKPQVKRFVSMMHKRYRFDR